VNYKPLFEDNGSFRLLSSASAYKYQVKIDKWDNKGYAVSFPIPVSFFGKTIPDRFGCNIIVKWINAHREVQRTSWMKGNLYDYYSPFIWGEVRIIPKPLLKNRIVLLCFSFFIGLIVAVLFSMIVSTPKRAKVIYKVESSEEEQRLFNKVKSIIDTRITLKDINLEMVAEEMGEKRGKIQMIVKRQTRLSFRNFIMYSRIEIAKERLRSSHSSEASIAETCGFADVNEMEKYFSKFLKTTPYKFRMEQQVA
jgi:AraC-like DNA-binding protein